MSLINKVLQDLEARRADLSDDTPVAHRVRAVAGAKKKSYRRFVTPLLGMFIVLGVAAVIGWGEHPFNGEDTPVRVDMSAILPSGEAAPIPKSPPPVPATVEEQVQQALLMPVFQLSEELSALPVAKPRASAGKISRRAEAPRLKVVAAAPKQRPSADSQEPVAAASKPPSMKKEAVDAGVVAQPSTPETFKQAAEISHVEPKKIAGTPGPEAEPALEEVVIPADIGPAPIEKQARALTAYERAENAFRRGVASLRRGHMSQAEAQFREAVLEDRSHLAAQQALVGMLIDAGRTMDAEAVLEESLDMNPRQPRQAMILARLQLERGDLELAIRTLQAGRPYAVNDAVYQSFLAAVLQRAERHEEAVGQYRSALALMPRNAVWLMGLGISLRAAGSDADALLAFEEAAAIGTLDSRLQAYVEQQRLQLARVSN